MNNTTTTAADARIDQLQPDPVGHLRSNLITWITGAPEEVIRALLKIRRNLDANLRKPAPVAGWKSIRPIAAELGLCSGHLARQCREIYAAQDMARQCTLHGRITWCLSPIAIAELRATHALASPAPVPGSDSSASPVSRATHAPSGVILDLGPAPQSAALSKRNTDRPWPAAGMVEVTP